MVKSSGKGAQAEPEKIQRIAALGVDLETQYRSIFENAIEGIYQTSADGFYLRANPALAAIYGYESAASLIADVSDIAGQLYVDPTRRDDFRLAMEEAGFVTDFEAQVFRRDRSIIWIRENARCVRNEAGELLYYEGTVEDITRRKKDEERIRLLATAFDTVADGILIIDDNLQVLAVNPAYEAMARCEAVDVVGKALDLFAPGFHDKFFFLDIWAEVRQFGRWQGEATCIRQGDDPFAATLNICAVSDGDNGLSHMVITCSDISQRKQNEQRIWYYANYDPLTQLPNRWLVTERLQQAMLRAERQKTGLALLFLDLNGFKQINDGLGHQAGDDLLRQVAKRLRDATRASDIVGRFGGDEFLIIAPEVTSRYAGSALIDKIISHFSEPFSIDGREIFCKPSIGIAYCPKDGNTPDALIRNADLAMYAAKQNTSFPFVSFDPEMQHLSIKRLNLENDLRRAIDRNELVLHYQPKVDTQNGRIVAAEALMRWQHPERGLIMPNEFIPLAEECGLIGTMGEWTLREACEEFLRWRADGLHIEGVSVNLSPRQFLDPNLAAVVQQILASTGIDPELLELELTEGAMSGDLDKALVTLRALKSLGVRISIDDFGTGYSSLARLKHLPIDVLKIDRSFVHDLDSNATAGRIVESIIDLAGVLGFRTVAERVETAAQSAILRNTQCHLIQGYLSGRPIPSLDFIKLLDQHRTAAPAIN
jgi:diguanylate cyclase (GGDEF)-like protein/PAS domain S-box-containing protein